MADNTVCWRSFSITFGTGLDIQNISTFASLILFKHYSINWDLRKTLHSICEKITEMDREVSGVFLIYFVHSGRVHTSNNYAVLGLAPCCIKFLAMRAFRIIFPDQHYKEALRNTNTPSLYDRRQELTTKLFKDIVNNPEHKLTNLLPPLNNDNTHFLRKNRKFNVPLYKTYRFGNSFITYNSNKFFE